MTTWRSTEFWQSAFVQVTGAVGLFTHIVDAGTYVALSTIALGIYAGARTVQKATSPQPQ